MYQVVSVAMQKHQRPVRREAKTSVSIASRKDARPVRREATTSVSIDNLYTAAEWGDWRRSTVS